MIRSLSGGAALAALVLLSACQSLPALPALPIARTGAVPGGQVVEAVVGTLGPLNPLFEEGANEHDIDSLIYQGLTTVNARQQVVGLLAKSWTMSPDGLTYTFTLRNDVRWADGSRFNADDVMFTYATFQSPDYQDPTEQLWKDVVVEKVSQLEVKFTLKAPSAAFPLTLRQGILPKHLFLKVAVPNMMGSLYSGPQAIGTGPFMASSITERHHVVTLERNPYASPRPYLDHFVFRSYATAADAMDAVSRGEADTFGDLAPQGTSALEKRPEVNVLEVSTFDFAAVLFDLTPDLAVFFQPPSVRLALTQAIDRKRIVNDVLEGHADSATGPIPPKDWAYSKQSASKYPYNPAAAVKALQDAGWTMNLQTGVLEKGGRSFQVHLATTDAYPYKQVAESVQAQLRQIGVQVVIDPVPASVLVSKYLIGKQFQLALADFDIGSDPDQSQLWHSGAASDSLNFTSADRLPKQALIDKDLEDGIGRVDNGVVRTDPATRIVAYADFQDLMADAAPAIFLFAPHYTYIVSKRVKGVHTNPVIDPTDRLEYVADWYATNEGG
jgi:peptide/nickel transport system substrate-binding protein